MMAKAYLTSYKLPVITTRGNNVSIFPHYSKACSLLQGSLRSPGEEVPTSFTHPG